MLSEAIIAAIAAGAGSVIGIIGKVAVDVIKAKKTVDQTELAKLEHNEKTEAALDRIEKKVVTITEEQRSFNLMYLRTSISFIYFEHDKDKKLPIHEYESVLGLYDVYKSLGGNGYIEELINDMKTWEKE